VLYRAELLPEQPLDDPGSPTTDREGFEPSRAVNPTRFPIVLLKPLGHLSTCPRGSPGEIPPIRNHQRRGWDSNPREPFGLDGLANRCRNHLATSPSPSVLPLLGSNQDSSDPESDVLPVTPRGSPASSVSPAASPARASGAGTTPGGGVPFHQQRDPRPEARLSACHRYRFLRRTAERETGLEPATLSLGS
jgi:hypothetical protein